MITIKEGNIKDSLLHTIVLPVDQDAKLKRSFRSLNKHIGSGKYDNGITSRLIGQDKSLSFQRSDRRLIILRLKNRKGKKTPVSSYISAINVVRRHTTALPVISMAVLVNDTKHNKLIVDHLTTIYKRLKIDIEIYNS